MIPFETDTNVASRRVLYVICLFKPPQGCLPQPRMILRLRYYFLGELLLLFEHTCCLVFYSFGENR